MHAAAKVIRNWSVEIVKSFPSLVRRDWEKRQDS